jgi:3-oxoacyl-[acyl-carrier protein] reductase
MVTGGSRGLGAAIVEGLLAAGYCVSTCSKSKSAHIDHMLNQYAARFFWSSCRIGDPASVDSFVRAAIAWSGRDSLYGLINNAAIARAGILASFPNSEIEQIVRVNLLGAIQVTRAASIYLVKHAGGARIINISSIIGIRGYNGLAAYSASKAGIDGLTRALARELGRRNVTVNSIAPGYMKTSMSATITETQMGRILRRTPLGRLVSEDDVFSAVRFLLSDGAAMLTGQTICIDGGLSS